jgi:undecaprenyl-diphosphatase
VIAVCVGIALRRPSVLLTLLFVYLADVLAYALKFVFDRPRPNLDPLVRVPTDPSFPSGHAATSFAGATMLALLVPRLAPALYLLATAIAFSRVYVGVHYPLDIVGGAVLGVAVAIALRWLAGVPRRSSGARSAAR